MRAKPWLRDDAALAKLTIDVAAFGLDIAAADIGSDQRGSARAAFARQVAMYLCSVAFRLSFGRIAIAFGRDRSTVTHACRIVEDHRECEAFDAWIANLETMLHRAPAPGGAIWSELQA